MTIANPFHSWWWIQRGEVTVNTTASQHRVPPHHWIFIPAGLKRTHSFTSESEIISISFETRWPNGTELIQQQTLLTGDQKAAPGVRAKALAVCRFLRSSSQPEQRFFKTLSLPLTQGLAFRACLDTFVVAVLEAVASTPNAITPLIPHDARLTHILHGLQSLKRVGPLPYSQWYDELGLTRAQIDYLSATHLHMTLRAHHDKLLTSEAAHRLRSTSRSVKEIAAELGFSDTAHFCRWLRRHTGQSPSSLRHAAA